jgi:hypothetical protein
MNQELLPALQKKSLGIEKALDTTESGYKNEV